MRPCTLYIVRHGQSEANRDNLCGGQTDSPLTELGVSQANEAKRLLSTVKFDAVYSSDLQRAAKTVEIIWGSPVPHNHQLFDLRERSFGELEGQSDDKWKALSKQFDEMYGSLPLEQRWQHSYADYIEGNAPLVKRFTASLQSIAQSHQGETVLIGTHGGCVRTLLVKLGYAEEADLPPGSFTNSAYIVVECDGELLKIKKVTGVKVGASTSE
jgi:probable phosphoglycerate mutase